MVDLTPEIIRELISYDPESGKMTWAVRDEKWFPAKRLCATWNTRYAGREALTASSSGGYLRGNVFDRNVKAHRIAWMHYHGRAPIEIDHINGVRTDNRIVNLREVADRTENLRNMGLRPDNKSGVTGVCWDAYTSRWKAEIMIRCRSINLGWFDSVSDASKARDLANIKYGFHPNHGRRPSHSLSKKENL